MATERTVGDLMDLVVARKGVGPESLAENKRLAKVRGVLKHANVVGVGVALKVTEGKTLADFSFTFYVAKKLALARLKAKDLVPPVVTTSTGRPVPTDVVELGVLKPDANVRHTPISPGFSVGHFEGDTGTLGAIVKRDGRFFLISNSHVLAKSGKAKKGDTIIYPGGGDGGKKSKDKVGALSDFVQLKTRGTNSVDSAIAEIDPDRVSHVMSQIKGIGLVRGRIKPKVGMKVTKVGRTSDKTQGTVLSAKFQPLRLPYPDVGDVSFGDQILITRFTQPGDSGSLVVDIKSKKAIGLHFASAIGGSVCAPIDQVLKAMRVQLVTGEI